MFISNYTNKQYETNVSSVDVWKVCCGVRHVWVWLGRRTLGDSILVRSAETLLKKSSPRTRTSPGGEVVEGRISVGPLARVNGQTLGGATSVSATRLCCFEHNSAPTSSMTLASWKYAVKLWICHNIHDLQHKINTVTWNVFGKR